ncbi:MAG: Zn-dependent oligopeptidase [Candidatus Eremiobacteraeota bacterium]|nr:Zn-dependent oligopeptidase [Candidatus Eremiobacteraeota bacterium]MBV8365019.1 Zn-dependent oligopeptidase [Candidatus Eremiobacteraeota bacterium]
MNISHRVTAAALCAALLTGVLPIASSAASTAPAASPAASAAPGTAPTAPAAPAASAAPAMPAAAPAAGGSLLPADTGVNWNLTPDQIKSTCDAALRTARDSIKQIEAIPVAQAGFNTGIKAVENTMATFNDTLVAQSVLSQISLDKAVRDASTACNEQESQFGVELASDPFIYAMAQLGAATATNANDRKLAELYMESGRRSGAGLDPTTRAQTTKLFNELNDLEIAFARQLGEDTTSVTISKSEAASLPPSFVKALKAEGDGFRVPVNESTYSQFLQNERSSAARQRYYIAYFNRGGEANVKRLQQAVAVRAQLAHLLGYPTWAAYQLDAKMAKTPQRVDSFLAQVDGKLLPRAVSEINVLKALKKSSGDASPWQPWDYGYYENLLIKTKYAVNDEVVRQYFPVTKVLPAVMGIYQKLLGVTFHPIVPADTWAPGVLEYSISDNASGKPIGWFFLDLYPRPGKFQHFANFPLRAGRVLPDGTWQMPISSIIGNWPVGAPGKPALLSHDDVVTFFHEFGHLMHSTLSIAPYETYYGTAVRGDFVEAPSQMLENWMWQPSILKEVSSNVDTGKPLPDDLITKMIALKHVDDGVQWTGQAFYAAYDMKIHSSGPDINVQTTWFDLKKKMTPTPAVAGTIPEAGFGHLMGGYDAGYYGYLWSRVYAQDMFTVFQKGGLENPVVGARYRQDILQPGGSLEPDQLLRNFLGREVNYDAFYRDIGITK